MAYHISEKIIENVCEVCTLGKMINVRHREQDIMAKSPLDLVHTDLADQ